MDARILMMDEGVLPTLEARNPPNEPIFSAIVCTFNRYDYLQYAINSLLQSSCDMNLFEIIIVDNSTDAVARQQFLSEFKPSRNTKIIQSQPPGLSRARNAGVAAARGKYVGFLDDDAVAAAGWVREAINTFELIPDVAAVGGPILPVHSCPFPSWMSETAMGSLSVLVYSGRLIFLPEHRYIYGANMAFRRDLLMAVGGFSEDLGRIGTSLLSNEETEVQDVLRSAGWRIYYNSKMHVFHYILPDRINQDWLRRRMAWQGLSDCLAGGIEQGPESFGQLLELGKEIGVDETILNVFSDMGDKEKFDKQLRFIREFAQHLFSDNTKHRSEKTVDASLPCERRGSPAVQPGMIVFAEPAKGHTYLYDAYAELGPSTIILHDGNAWGSSSSDLAGLDRFAEKIFSTAEAAGGPVFILTLDYWLREGAAQALRAQAQLCESRKFAILHRIPGTLESQRQLSAVSALFERIFVFSEDMRDDLIRKHELNNVAYLPHHAATELYTASDKQALRKKYGIPPGSVVVSLIGELRAGKGAELLLEAIPLLSSAAKDKLFFVFAGSADESLIGNAYEAASSTGIRARLDLRPRLAELQYAVLTETEFSDYISVTDWGLLLYHGPQSSVMSGVLPCYVFAGASVIAIKGSYVAKVVEKNSLGSLLNSESPTELATVLNQLGTGSLGNRDQYRAPYNEYREGILIKNVLVQLSRLISGGC